MSAEPILVTGATGPHGSAVARALLAAGYRVRALIAGASGRWVAYRELPISEVAARSADIAAMYRFLGAVGYRADGAELRARFPELSPTTFRAWVEAELRR